MSSAKKTFFINKDGSMRAIRCDLTDIADVVEKHWHRGPDTQHSMIMVWGKVLVNMTREEPIELEASEALLRGDMIDFPAGAEYEIKVLKAPVRFWVIWGPNISLQRYQRMCPECRAIKFKAPPSSVFISQPFLPDSSTLQMDDDK